MGLVRVIDQLQARRYGLPTRVRVIRQEGPANRDLWAWYPAWQLLDPYAAFDLTSPWEQAWTARRLARRATDGAVVELGTWLGATTRAIGLGLDRRGGHRPPVHVYDTFEFTDVEARTAGTPLEGRHRDGDRFRDLYDRRVAGVPGLSVHEGDVLAERWDGGPISFLFVDLAKTWEVWRHVRASFLAAVPVGGVVVQQDWAHANDPWLHLWHHRWRDHFEVLGHIAHSSSVCFRVARPLPAAALGPDGPADYGADEVRAAFAWATALVRAPERPHVAGAHVMFHALHGDLDDGVATLIELAATVPLTGELASVAAPELARRIAQRDATAGPAPHTP